MQANTFRHLMIPFDFSETAKIALRHAACMSHKLNAKLSLLNVMEDFSVEQVLHPGTNKNVSFDLYKKEVLLKLDEDTIGIRREYGITIDCYVQQGRIFKQVAEFAKSNDVDLVIIGSHGVKARDQFFLGSNAYKVVNNTKIPVLSIQKVATEVKYKRVVLPMDSSFHTREKIAYAAFVAAAYGSKVFITGLLTHHDKESTQKMHAILNQTEKYLAGKNIEIEVLERDSKNLASDTLNIAEEVNADLIVIMTEQEKTFSGLFLGPYAQQIVNHSLVPVLSIPPRVSMVMGDVSI